MRKRGHGSYHGRVQDLELLIFVVEVAFEQLIHREVGGMRRYAPAGNDLCTLPKTQEPLFLIEYFPCPEEGQSRSTRLEMSLYTISLGSRLAFQ